MILIYKFRLNIKCFETNKDKASKEEWINEHKAFEIEPNVYLIKPINFKESYKRGKCSNLNILRGKKLKLISGLENCQWPGRNQIIEHKETNTTFFIDGAHTVESLQQFVDWFQEVNKEKNSRNVLLFNFTGERNGEAFLNIMTVK